MPEPETNIYKIKNQNILGSFSQLKKILHSTCKCGHFQFTIMMSCTVWNRVGKIAADNHPLIIPK